MTPTVDEKSLSDRLCWGGTEGGTPAKKDDKPAPKAPELKTTAEVVDYLKANPNIMCYMSKAEIIAMIAGPDMAAKLKDGVGEVDENGQPVQKPAAGGAPSQQPSDGAPSHQPAPPAPPAPAHTGV